MQNMFRKQGLARRLATLLTAVMILTSEAQVFLQTPLFAAAADTEETAVSTDEATGDETLPAVEDTDGADTAEEREDVEGLSLKVSEVQYGEDGSNENGNLDALFAPVLEVEGVKLVPGSDFTVSYKFFTDAEAAAAVTAESFADAEGVELSTVNAGTELTVVAYAVTGKFSYLADAKFTVAKRKVSVSYKQGEDAAIDGRDIAGNDSYTISGDAVDYSALTITAGEGYVLSLPEAKEAIADSISFDVSAVDVSKDAEWTVPMELTLTEDFAVNYEIVGNVFGDFYVTKAHYYVTFQASNDGKQFQKTYEFPEYDWSGTAYDLLEELEKTDEVFATVYDEQTYSTVYTLGGFIDGKDTVLKNWTVYTDGFNNQNDYSNASYVEAGGKSYTLSGTKDYLFVAHLTKRAADDLKVSVIPAVYFDNRAHLVMGDKANLKKQVDDLRLAVYSSDYESVEKELVLNTDYTVKYHNNTAASMKLDENGTYVPTWKSNSERPSVDITGKGKYAGFSATVYFDILPVNLGKTEYQYEYKNSVLADYQQYYWIDNYTYKAQIGGVWSNCYDLKEIAKVKPSVTKEFYTNDSRNKWQRYTITLKEGTDYTGEVYLWNENASRWDLQDDLKGKVSSIKKAGDYLFMIRGTGNYCGAVYDNSDSSSSNTFRTGIDEEFPANPSHNIMNTYQFRVTDDTIYDLARAKVTVKKPTQKYATGVYYGKDEFGISVTVGKGSSKKELEAGKDYNLFIGGSSTVNAAGTYWVRIEGIAPYYGTLYAKQVKVTGLKLKASYFKLEPTTLPFSGKADTPKLVLTAAGQKAGLSLESGKEYSVYGANYYKSGKNYYSESDSSVIKSGKHVIRVAGSGPAIEKGSYAYLNWTRTDMTLQQAIDNGYIKLSVSADGAYIIKGTTPNQISYSTIQQSGYWDEETSAWINTIGWQENVLEQSDLWEGRQVSFEVYSADNQYMGWQTLTFSFKKNTKHGQKATVVIKGSGLFKGSVSFDYTVVTRKIEWVEDGYYEAGQIFAVVTDSLQSKGKLDKPAVKLYQSYCGKNGVMMSAPLTNKQYTLTTHPYVIADKESEIIAQVFAKDGSSKEFAFVDEVGNAAEIYVCDFGLYEKKLNVNDIKEATVRVYDEENHEWIDKTVKVTKGVMDLSMDFTGRCVEPDMVSITLNDGTVLRCWEHVRLSYGTNIAAAKNGGTVTFTGCYSWSDNTYKYGGSVSLKFTIKAVDGVTM